MDATSTIEAMNGIASSTGEIFNGLTPFLYVVFGLVIVLLGLSYFFKFTKYLLK